MDKKNITIALADDHILVNEILSKVINGFEGYTVIFTAENGSLFMQKIQTGKVPDLAIIDVKMPETDGYKLAAWLQQNYPDVRVLVLTMIDSDLSTVLLIQLGVRGILRKKAGAGELQKALDAVTDTGYYFPGSRLATLMRAVSPKKMLANSVMLTDSELKFLQLVTNDLSYKEIADILKISVRTVEKHRDSLFSKLSVKSRTGLVLYAVKSGLVSEDAI